MPKHHHKHEATPAGKGQSYTIPNHPAMVSHPAPQALEKALYEPYMPRANLAVSVDTPEGTTKDGWAKQNQDRSTLQQVLHGSQFCSCQTALTSPRLTLQHVLFFDRDRDDIIWPSDTFTGFHDLGYNVVWCITAVLIIHSGFSYFTSDSWIPDPFFRLSVARMHRAKHGSDTGTYDTEVRTLVTFQQSPAPCLTAPDHSPRAGPICA